MELFDRNISFETRENDEGNLVISGRMKDTRLGEPIRDIEVTAEVDLVEGRILSMGGNMRLISYDECHEALKSLSHLVGERIVPGFSDLVRRVVGSSEGCTHLSVLVTNLGHVSVQARGALLASKMPDRGEALDLVKEHALELGILGGCYTWREDGPMMRSLKEQLKKSGPGDEPEA
ncbi:MAG: DUF2889 domain-containing protein [Actinomycetota bacterium]